MRRPGMVSHSESSLKAISRMSPPQFGHSSGNSSHTRAISLAQACARRVVRAGLVIRIRVTTASRGATVVPIPTGRGLALLADVAFSRVPWRLFAAGKWLGTLRSIERDPDK